MWAAVASSGILSSGVYFVTVIWEINQGPFDYPGFYMLNEKLLHLLDPNSSVPIIDL